jgi:hypothetical protein
VKKKKPQIGLVNDIEAARFADILAQEGIPCAIVSNDSSVYTGIFQLQNGWGYAEVPEEYLEQAESLLEAYRESLES